MKEIITSIFKIIMGIECFEINISSNSVKSEKIKHNMYVEA